MRWRQTIVALPSSENAGACACAPSASVGSLGSSTCVSVGFTKSSFESTSLKVADSVAAHVPEGAGDTAGTGCISIFYACSALRRAVVCRLSSVVCRHALMAADTPTRPATSAIQPKKTHTTFLRQQGLRPWVRRARHAPVALPLQAPHQSPATSKTSIRTGSGRQDATCTRARCTRGDRASTAGGASGAKIRQGADIATRPARHGRNHLTGRTAAARDSCTLGVGSRPK